MNSTPRFIRSLPLAAAAVFFAAAASAQGTWDLSTSSCDPNGTPGSAGCLQGSVSASVTAWANTGSGGTFVRANISDQGSSGVGATSVAGAAFGSIAAGTTEITSDGHHAFDNVGESNGQSPYLGGSTEMALIEFTSAISLTALTVGWYQTDADVSLFRWTGGGSGPSLTSATNTGLVSSGWSLVSNIDADPSNVANPIAGAPASSWWLVSTYFGSKSQCDGSGNNCTFDAGNDYFKLLSFAGVLGETPSGNVPEPASLALVGVALFGIARARRRVARA